MQDVVRTNNYNKNKDKLNNLLKCYSKRNGDIGYC